MSVGLFRLDGNIKDKKSNIIYSENVASEAFYTKVWAKAVSDLKIKIFKDGSDFLPDQVNEVLDELHLLLNWCNDNLVGVDHNKMQRVLINLMKRIPEEAPNSDEPFYIF